MGRILQVSPDQLERLVEAIDRQKKARAEEMPTEVEALAVMQRAYTRLQELGWRDASYCPKDGTIFDSIEAGSTGIHDGQYQGRWPNGSWWVFEAGDIWPSRPILFRLKHTTVTQFSPKPTPDQDRDAREGRTPSQDTSTGEDRDV